jgi:hypothetical protein
VTLEMMGESKARTMSPTDNYFQSLDCGLTQIARDHATFGMIHAYATSPFLLFTPPFDCVWIHLLACLQPRLSKTPLRACF